MVRQRSRIGAGPPCEELNLANQDRNLVPGPPGQGELVGSPSRRARRNGAARCPQRDSNPRFRIEGPAAWAI